MTIEVADVMGCELREGQAVRRVRGGDPRTWRVVTITRDWLGEPVVMLSKNFFNGIYYEARPDELLIIGQRIYDKE